MPKRDLDKFSGAGITEYEKAELIELKEREIRALENRNKIVIGAILAVIVCGVIAAGVFLLGRNTNDIAGTDDGDAVIALQSTNAALALQLTVESLNQSANIPPQVTNAPQVNPTSLPPTVLPAPTNTSLPTPTSPPTDTPITDTVPGTILEVGQAWKQEGMELRLTNVEMDTASSSSMDPVQWGLFITFELSNFTGNDVPIRYNLAEAISAADNFGQMLKYGSTNRSWTDYRPEPVSIVLNSGTTIRLSSFDYWDSLASIFFFVDVTNVNITEVIVTVNISRINNAQWRIPIYH